MKLNIGCGGDIREGYINLDIRSLNHVDLVSDTVSLPIRSGAVDEIVASDIIEHFPWKKVRAVLKEWRRVLKGSGHLWIRTPDLGGIMQLYSRRPEGWRRTDGNDDGIDPIVERIYGGQDYQSNFHYVILDRTSIADLLKEEGFFVESVLPDGGDISNMCVSAWKKLFNDEAWEQTSRCEKYGTCPIVKEFMDGVSAMELLNEEPVQICSNDIRFYGYHNIENEERVKYCSHLRELKEGLGEMRITWEAPTFGASGYAYAARGYIEGLADLGTHLRVQPIWGDCRMECEDGEESE